jgi:hypothetical protein
MVAFTRSSASRRIRQILLTTAHHFEIRALPSLSSLSLRDEQPALPHGEFIDPLPFRWVNAPRPA